MYKDDNGKETHLDKIEARAGSRNTVNRNALVMGLLLVMLAFLVILAVGFFTTKQAGADNVAVNEGAQ